MSIGMVLLYKMEIFRSSVEIVNVKFDVVEVMTLRFGSG
jgi:hypothetical protein